MLLGRLGITFRTHRDDSQFNLNLGKYSGGGVGNFLEVLIIEFEVVIQLLKII